jgi:type IV secretory pathway component VirB8
LYLFFIPLLLIAGAVILQNVDECDALTFSLAKYVVFISLLLVALVFIIAVMLKLYQLCPYGNGFD